MSDKPQVVKQYGLQKSGTNYLKHLLEENFHVQVLVNKGGWKHGAYRLPSLLGRELNCMVSTKNVLAWLFSMWKYSGKSEKFVPFVMRGTMVEHWGVMHRNWLHAAEKLTKPKMVFIRYEDVLVHPGNAMGQAAEALDLGPRKTAVFWTPKGELTSTGSQRKKHFDPRFYRQEKYRAQYNKKLLAFVRENVDPGVVAALGYEAV